MNIEQRFRSILWPITFFVAINTAAIIGFVFFDLDALDRASAHVATVFRVSVMLLSVAAAMYSYITIRNGAEEEHKSHLRRKEHSRHLSATGALVVLVEDICMGLLQALFIFIVNVSFWLIVNFTDGAVSAGRAVTFWAGFGLILLASAYVIVHRLALAVLAIRK